MTQLLGPIIVVALLAALIYVLVRPHWAVVLVIVMFPLEQLLQSYVPSLLATPWLFNVGVGGVAGMALASRILRGDQVLYGMKNRVLLLVLLIYAIAVIGLMYTPSPDEARAMLVKGLPYHVLLLFVMPALIVDLRELNRVLMGTLLAGTVIAVLILLNPASTTYAGRMVVDLGPSLTGTFRGNPLAIATLGGTLALVAVLFLPQRASILINGLRLAAVVIGLGLAIRSGSRGQVLAAALSAIVFYPVARQVKDARQFLLVSLGFLTVAVIIFASFRLFIGVDNAARWDSGLMMQSTGDRLGRVTSLLGAWLSSPMHWLLGLGPNAFSAIYTPDPSYVHNLVAEVLGEEGLLGFSLLALVFLALWRGGRNLFRWYAHDPVMRATAAVLAAVCFFELLVSFKQGSFLLTPAPFPWMVILAKIAIVERRALAWQAEHDELDEQEPQLEPDYDYPPGAQPVGV